jgi:RNA polymerase sigma-70 factor (ECF subfamily)
MFTGEDVNEDDRLIDLTLAGDSAAFGQIVLKYQDRLFNTLVHVVGCAEEAQDVAQEAFVLAFQKLKSFQRKSGLYTWLYRIAMNTWISRNRRMRPKVSVDAVRESSGSEPEDPTESPEEGIEREERIEQIRIAISELSDEHRGVLVLRDIDGCCYEEIAEMLDIPVGTVRSRLHRARMDLKTKLSDVLHENI